MRLFAIVLPVLAASVVGQATAKPNICLVSEHGARPDDRRSDTEAFQAAIDRCAAIGGRVIVPAGRFDVGHVRLRSNTDLYLSPAARLVGSLNLADYPPIAELNGQRVWFYGSDVSNVSISGLGTFDGQAEPVYRRMADIIARDRNDPRADERVRFGLMLRNCNNARLRDFTIRNTQMFLIALHTCDNVVADGITLSAPIDSHNTDGFQIIDSRDVRISNCNISVGDDGIVTKAGVRSIERLQVTNCVIQSDDGAIKFGTRSVSAVVDSLFANIAIKQSRFGVALFMIHGGEYRNNRFSDIRIETGGRHARTFPIFVDIDDRVDDPSARQFGVVDGLVFDGIDITTGGNILIAGHPQSPVSNLVLADINIDASGREPIKPTDQKPRGNRRFEPVPGSPDLASVDATIVLGHVNNVSMRDVQVYGPTRRKELHVEAAQNVWRDGQPVKPH
jgi:hypothetical protein